MQSKNYIIDMTAVPTQLDGQPVGTESLGRVVASSLYASPSPQMRDPLRLHELLVKLHRDGRLVVSSSDRELLRAAIEVNAGLVLMAKVPALMAVIDAALESDETAAQ